MGLDWSSGFHEELLVLEILKIYHFPSKIDAKIQGNFVIYPSFLLYNVSVIIKTS